MLVIPAIDLRGGNCVRLRQGDFEQETIFGDDPAAMAALWQSQGAELIHLVDLDGAKAGRPINTEAVRRILATVNVPCQLGGGIRDEATIAVWLNAGISRVVVGTQALRDPEWFARMADDYPGQLLLGIDARNGRVAAEGWLEQSDTGVIELAQRFDALPLAGIIYTDIAQDGTLAGPSFVSTAALVHAVKTPVIASGGVGTLEDVTNLATLPIAGAIVGRALYDHRFTLSQAIEACRALQ
jgi:phosphoribosylformimino-5-aminoimidazole carboxamide ribotide isomerase